MTTISGKYDGFDYSGSYEEIGDDHIRIRAGVSRFGNHVGEVHGQMIHGRGDSLVDIAKAVSLAVGRLINHDRRGWDYDIVREIHESGRHAGIDYRLLVWDDAEGLFFFRGAVVTGFPAHIDIDASPFTSLKDAIAHGHEVARGIIDN